jgi:hypothetical protein
MEDYTYARLELTDGMSFSEAVQLALVPLVSVADGIEFSDAINFGFEANLSDSISISESFSYNMHKTLFIREGFTGGWGNQPWGSSAWGGNDTSFDITDELTVDKIAALGTGILDAVDTFSITDQLTLLLSSREEILDNDEFNLRVYISDVLNIVKV